VAKVTATGSTYILFYTAVNVMRVMQRTGISVMCLSENIFFTADLIFIEILIISDQSHHGFPFYIFKLIEKVI
jgi:hypothetical protein